MWYVVRGTSIRAIIGISTIGVVNFQNLIRERNKGRHVVKRHSVNGLHRLETEYVVGDGCRESVKKTFNNHRKRECESCSSKL
jgi:hypothetical protein